MAYSTANEDKDTFQIAVKNNVLHVYLCSIVHLPVVNRLNALHGFLAEQRSEDVGGQEAAGTSLGRVGDSMQRSFLNLQIEVFVDQFTKVQTKVLKVQTKVQNLQIEAFCCSNDKSSSPLLMVPHQEVELKKSISGTDYWTFLLFVLLAA